MGSDNIARNFNLSEFLKGGNIQIGNSERSFKESWGQDNYRLSDKSFTKDEINQIIDGRDLNRKIFLSRLFFQNSATYAQLVINYAALLKYYGILVPSPAWGQNLNNKKIQKQYFKAMNFLDRVGVQKFCTDCAVKVITDGVYYGLINKKDEDSFSYINLPTSYCRSNYNDLQGNNLVEFNLNYFDTIPDEKKRKLALNSYPKYVRTGYKNKNKNKDGIWLFLPAEDSICFTFMKGAPIFLGAISAILDYDENFLIEREKNLDEIKKIIIQKIPHDKTTLLFEPPEAAAIHQGTVEMLKNEKNISLMTTYSDVDSIVSKTSSDRGGDFIENSINNIYLKSGLSKELFNSTTSMTLSSSIKKDISFMMILGNEFSLFFTNLINRIFGNNTINFTYKILPISIHNEKEYIDNTLKLANSGYSLLLPGIAMGFSQTEFQNIKNLENGVLKITDLLIPPALAYTQSGKSSDTESKEGRPEKESDEVNPKTVQNKDTKT